LCLADENQAAFTFANKVSKNPTVSAAAIRHRVTKNSKGVPICGWRSDLANRPGTTGHGDLKDAKRIGWPAKQVC
jgi:hypothetical protein